MTATRKVLGLLLALVVIFGGALFSRHQEAGPDREAIFKACMAAIPGSATNFDDYQTCTDRANAAR